MKIEEYVKVTKELIKEGLSENIICRILEEEAKDRRTVNVWKTRKNASE